MVDKPILKFDSSWDDGARDDIKIAMLLRKHKLPGTFYIPTICDLSPLDIINEFHDFELGGHTVNHPEDLKRLSPDELAYEITENKYWLENLCRYEITKFAYPGGRYNDTTIAALKEAGYKQARTTIVLQTEPREDFRHDTTIHVYPRREYEGKPWNVVAREMAEKASQTGGYFHIWGHAADLNHYDYWKQLDDFFTWLNTYYEIQKYEHLSTSTI